MVDLFTIAKQQAKELCRGESPGSLEEFQRLLVEAMQQAVDEELAAGTMMYAPSQEKIAMQAQKSASWWWNNVCCKERAKADGAQAVDRARLAFAKIKLLHAFGGCILDTETTGLGADSRIIELSIIDMRGRTLFSSLFNPGQKLTPRIVSLTGITDEMLEGRPAFSDLAADVDDILSCYSLTGWNVSFDIRMLRQEFSRCNMQFDDSDVHDLMGLCACAMEMPSEYLKLIEAKRMLGVGESQEHRSLADCQDTLAVVEAVLNGARPGKTYDEQPELPFQAI